MKLSPYFSSFANFARRLDNAGVDGLVLFNRFYQPDIDLDELEVVPNVILSTPQAMRLPLRWIAILNGRVRGNFRAVRVVFQLFEARQFLDMLDQALADLVGRPDHFARQACRPEILGVIHQIVQICQHRIARQRCWFCPSGQGSGY